MASKWMTKMLWAFGIIRIITIKFYTMNRCAWQDERVKQSNDKWSAAKKELPRHPQWKFVKLAVDVKPRCEIKLPWNNKH